MRKSIYIGAMMALAVLAGCGKTGTQTAPAQAASTQAAETTAKAEMTAGAAAETKAADYRIFR